MNWQCSPVLQPHILHRMTDPREDGMGFWWNKDFVTGAQPPPLAGFAEVSLHKLHLSSGSASQGVPGAAPPSAPAKGKRTLVKAAGKGKVKSDLLNLLGSRMRNQTHSAGDSIGSTEEKGPRNTPEEPQADRETWGRMSRPPSLTPAANSVVPVWQFHVLPKPQTMGTFSLLQNKELFYGEKE